MPDTYYEEPRSGHSADVAVGCNDCDWFEFVPTIKEAKALIAQHQCPDPDDE